MQQAKTTFITTVLNEEKTIERLLESLFQQSQLPHEIIIVDGGSTDKTVSVISNYNSPTGGSIKVLTKKGNRSVGRNEAITHAGSEIILISDSGCVLDKNWIKNITKPFLNPSTRVVAGYYRGEAKTIFQKCLIPYVLVMEDKLQPGTFLPASRSMAIRKSVWKILGGFDERLSHNEDYAFAKNMERRNVDTYFCKSAVVLWMPRETIGQTFTMFKRFAYGDVEAGIVRPKVLFIFLRYIIFLILLVIFFVSQSAILFLAILNLVLFYFLWAIQKNYRYVNDVRAIFYLPLLQVLSDIAVIFGSVHAILKNKFIDNKK